MGVGAVEFVWKLVKITCITTHYYIILLYLLEHRYSDDRIYENNFNPDYILI